MSAAEIWADPQAHSGLVGIALALVAWTGAVFAYRTRRRTRLAGVPVLPIERLWRMFTVGLAVGIAGTSLIDVLRWFLAPDRSPGGVLKVWDAVVWMLYAAWVVTHNPNDDNQGGPKKERRRWGLQLLRLRKEVAV